MAESAGPQLGAGNRAHYVFSREVSGGGGRRAAPPQCRCNGIISDQLGAGGGGGGLIKTQPKTK